LKYLPLNQRLKEDENKEKISDISTRDLFSEDSQTSDDDKLDSSLMLKRPTSCKETIKKRDMKTTPKYKRQKYGIDKLDKAPLKRKPYKITNFISVKDLKF